MSPKTPLFLSILLGTCLSQAAVAVESKAPSVTLSAAQIVDKHIAARGGLQAWHEVQALSVDRQDGCRDRRFGGSQRNPGQGRSGRIGTAAGRRRSGRTGETHRKTSSPAALQRWRWSGRASLGWRSNSRARPQCRSTTGRTAGSCAPI